MPLPEEHLVYPRRHHGSDQDRYPWRTLQDRPKRQWPGGAAAAAVIVVPIEHHPLNPSGKPFKHPGAMQTPYPDLRHYTTRDYGSRVGVFRILDALAAAKLTAVFPVNAIMLDRAPPLIEAIAAGGHEIAAYGWSTDALHWSGMDEAEERALVGRTRERFRRAGLEPVTWMSPALQQSFRTLDLIAAEGFTVCLDWEPDEVPVPMLTASGLVMAVPLYNELDDRTLMIDRRQTEDEWADQVLEAADYLKGGAERFGGGVLSFTLTPYVAGQPFRAAAMRRLLNTLGADAAVWSATAAQVAAS